MGTVSIEQLILKLMYLNMSPDMASAGPHVSYLVPCLDRTGPYNKVRSKTSDISNKVKMVSDGNRFERQQLRAFSRLGA